MYPSRSHSASCTSAGTTQLILIQGSNLIRADLTLQYRVSPADAATLRRAVLVHPSLMEEWNVLYLVEERVRLSHFSVMVAFLW